MAYIKENLELLIEKGADVNAVDVNGCNALMSCCSRRDTDPSKGIEILLKNGTDISAKGSKFSDFLKFSAWKIKNELR